MSTTLRGAALFAMLVLAASAVLPGCAFVKDTNAGGGQVSAAPSGDLAGGFAADAPALHSETPPSPPDIIRVYFTSPRYPDVESGRVRTVEHALLDAIHGAEQSLDIAIYLLDLDSVVNGILDAHQRGIKVRVVTDSDALGEYPAYKRFEKAGIRVVDDRRKALMHNKFMIVDGEAVWSGSNNWTETCTYWNNNNAVFVQSTELAADFTTEFEEMYLDYRFGEGSPRPLPYESVTLNGSRIEVCMSPEGRCAQKVIDAVLSARRSIRFMVFAFTHNDLGKAVEQQMRSGIDVAGVFETRDADIEAGEYTLLNRLDADIILDGNPYYMHHKVFILDEETVVTGSFNFSRNADSFNDENMLIIHDEGVAEKYLEEFARVFAQAKQPPGN